MMEPTKLLFLLTLSYRAGKSLELKEMLHRLQGLSYSTKLVGALFGKTIETSSIF